MKVLIDIPEELYKANHRGLEADELWDLRIAIKNGTPIDKTLEIEVNRVLEKIRAEIEQEKTYTCRTENGEEFTASADLIIHPDKRYFTSGLDKALEIIDKHLKGI